MKHYSNAGRSQTTAKHLAITVLMEARRKYYSSHCSPHNKDSRNYHDYSQDKPKDRQHPFLHRLFSKKQVVALEKSQTCVGLHKMKLTLCCSHEKIKLLNLHE